MATKVKTTSMDAKRGRAAPKAKTAPPSPAPGAEAKAKAKPARAAGGKRATKAKAKDTSPLPSATQFRFGYLVHDVSRMRRTVMDQTVAPLGLTRSQWSILSTLSRSSNEGMMQADIARLMDVGKVTIGGLVGRLEAAGLVERRSDAKDKRAKKVYITALGYDTIRAMIDVAQVMNDEILIGISEEDRRITEDTLMKVKDNLKRMISRNRRDRQGKAGGAVEEADEGEW